MVKCGLSELNITPCLGKRLPGHLNERISDGIGDELFARAFVVSSRGKKVAILTIDGLDLESSDVAKIREGIFEKTGIDKACIMICLSHTHTGGPVADSFVTKKDDEYVDFLIKKAQDAVVLANNRAVPSKIATGRGIVSDISFNRRYFMKDNRVMTNPGKQRDQVLRPAGPTDPHVDVIKIENCDKKPVGVFVSFACHTDVVGGTKFSADYPGWLSKTLKKLYGEDFICLFANGASGDINHINIYEEKMPEHHKMMGRVLAGEVFKVMEQITGSDDIIVDGKMVRMDIKSRETGLDETNDAIRILKSPQEKEIDKLFAGELMKYYENKRNSYSVDVGVIRIGNGVIGGFPGDVFVELGLEVKSRSPFAHTITVSHTNGRNGYLPTKEAFSQGGYEVKTTPSNRLCRDGGSIIAEELIGIIGEMEKEK